MYITLTLNVLSIYETVDFCLLFKELWKLFMSLETWVEVQHENSLIFFLWLRPYLAFARLIYIQGGNEGPSISLLVEATAWHVLGAQDMY